MQQQQQQKQKKQQHTEKKRFSITHGSRFSSFILYMYGIAREIKSKTNLLAGKYFNIHGYWRLVGMSLFFRHTPSTSRAAALLSVSKFNFQQYIPVHIVRICNMHAWAMIIVATNTYHTLNIAIALWTWPVCGSCLLSRVFMYWKCIVHRARSLEWTFCMT